MEKNVVIFPKDKNTSIFPKDTHTHTGIYIYTILRTRTCRYTTMECVKEEKRKNRPSNRPPGLRSRSDVRGSQKHSG
jgi:hypothetical protein